MPDVAPQDSRISRIRWTSFTRSARVAVPCGQRGRGQPRPGASRGGPEGVGPAGPCGRIAEQGHTHTDKPPVASGRGALGSGDGRREGLEAEPIRLRALHARRPLQRSATGPGGGGSSHAPLERSSMGQDPAVVAPPRASRSWTSNGVWLSWDWTPTSCRPCWTWKACSRPSLATVGVNARLSRDTGLGVGPHGPTGEGRTPLAGFSWAGS